MQTITNTCPKVVAMDQEHFNAINADLDADLRKVLLDQFAQEASLVLGYPVIVTLGEPEVEVDMSEMDTEPCPPTQPTGEPPLIDEWRPLATLIIPEEGDSFYEIQSPPSLEPTVLFDLAELKAHLKEEEDEEEEKAFKAAYAAFTLGMAARSGTMLTPVDGYSLYFKTQEDPAHAVLAGS